MVPKSFTSEARPPLHDVKCRTLTCKSQANACTASARRHKNTALYDMGRSDRPDLSAAKSICRSHCHNPKDAAQSGCCAHPQESPTPGLHLDRCCKTALAPEVVRTNFLSDIQVTHLKALSHPAHKTFLFTIDARGHSKTHLCTRGHCKTLSMPEATERPIIAAHP